MHVRWVPCYSKLHLTPHRHRSFECRAFRPVSALQTRCVAQIYVFTMEIHSPSLCSRIEQVSIARSAFAPFKGPQLSSAQAEERGTHLGLIPLIAAHTGSPNGCLHDLQMHSMARALQSKETRTRALCRAPNWTISPSMKTSRLAPSSRNPRQPRSRRLSHRPASRMPPLLVAASGASSSPCSGWWEWKQRRWGTHRGRQHTLPMPRCELLHWWDDARLGAASPSVSHSAAHN